MASPFGGQRTRQIDQPNLAVFSVVLLILGVALGWVISGATNGTSTTRNNDLIASFRTSSGAQQTFYAAACDIIAQPGATVIRTPRGFIYDAVKHTYKRYNMYEFTATNNGDGTYGLVAVNPVGALDSTNKLYTLDDASAC